MYASSHHQSHHSILYPTEWTRFDPAQNSYSPLAQFSSYTLREHNETLDKLALQMEVVARKLAEHDVSASEDHRRYTRMLDALQREESDIVVLLSHNRQRIEELEKGTANEVARRREEVELNHQSIRDFEEELGNMAHLENDLLAMKRTIEEKLAATNERKALFSREYRHGMSILETDHREAKTASAFTTSMLNPNTRMSIVESPRRRSPLPPTASTVVHLQRSPLRSAMRSPVAAVRSPVAPAQAPLSPTRPRASVVQPRASLRGSPKRTASSVLFPATVQQASVPNMSAPPPPPDYSVGEPTDPFRRLSDAAERLHNACREGWQEVIRGLLRTDQSICMEQHPLTGDTALHVLCASPHLLLEAVTDLCLANNDSLSVFNKQGLTPFHVACLNTHDANDVLKMFMVTNLNCDPNQRNAFGETVAHLCARSDYTGRALQCVVERMRVDVTIRTQVTNRQGTSQSMTALDVARDSGDKAVGNAQYLTRFFRDHQLQ